MYLNCHSHYSLRYGTMSETALLDLAVANDIQHLVLTDINNTSACLNFTRIAPNYNIKPVIGIDFRNGTDQQFIGIAKNNKGFFELNTFLSEHLHEKKDILPIAPVFENAFIIYPYEKVGKKQVLKENEYIGIRPQQLNQLQFSPHSHQKEKLVVLQTVTFRSKTDYNCHRLLRAIDNNVLLSRLISEQQGKVHDSMYPIGQLKDLYKDAPYILKNTENLIARCNIHFDFSTNRAPKNQKTYTGSKNGDIKLIKKLCRDGLQYRYRGNVNDDINKRVEKELDLIQSMDFISYFLINWDIVDYAKRKGYFYVGRGSGANSIIAYLLGITDVDPVELDLYFERFINLYRTTPPDFDIDFSWRDREDVTRYIFERFDNVALLATYNTFHYKSSVREVGKVFGLPPHEIDALSEKKFYAGGLDDMAKLVLKYGKLLRGKPNHLSIHAGGILISEKSIHHYSATNMPPKGFPTVQFDLVAAEDVGLYKFDILGQRGLAKIKETLEIVRYNQPEKADIDIHDVKKFIEDKEINDLVKTSQCIGCFYVESPAMRMLLKKLEVDNYLGLVAASSIIRPGVAKSGMMREYILRRKDPKRTREKAHPILLDLMRETYGVMVYQEDVIKVAHYYGGLSLAEADYLRRGMSGKYRSREEFQKVKAKFINNCLEQGRDKKEVFEVWRQIESFAGYAFSKGHSASYAVESYQSLFLKTYFPLEYTVAILNNGGGFYGTASYVHEAKMLGGEVHLPCVNRSWNVTIIKGKDIYLGLHYLKSLEKNTIKKIIIDREENGLFASFRDFIDRIPISIEQISILIRIGAFRFTGESKQTLLWQAHYILNKTSEKQFQQLQLFSTTVEEIELPKLDEPKLADAYDQLELLGFTLSDPFLLMEKPPRKYILAKDLPALLNKRIAIYGSLVAIKNTSTIQKKRMYFGTFTDREGVFFDTTHFPTAAARYPFRGYGIYKIYGKVVVEFGFYSLEVDRLERQAYIPDPRYDDAPAGEMTRSKRKPVAGMVSGTRRRR